MDPRTAEVIVGTGGIGWGVVFDLIGNHSLGRNESRAANLRDSRDYAKLHIVLHYCATLLRGGSRRPRLIAVGKVGRDDPGQRLLAEIERVGIDASHVEQVPGVSTLFATCFIYPDSDGGNITSVNGASQLVSPADVERVETLMADARGRGIALALPEVPLEARQRLLDIATRHGFLRIAAVTSEEAQTLRDSLMFKSVDLLALNVDEAAALAGASGELEHIRLRCVEAVTRVNPDIRLCITVGRRGSWAFHRGTWEYVPAVHVNPLATAGAGDAYLAAVTVGLMAGLPFIETPPRQRAEWELGEVRTACDFGAVVAAMAVLSPHTIHPDLDAFTVARWASERGVSLPASLIPSGAVAGENHEDH